MRAVVGMACIALLASASLWTTRVGAAEVAWSAPNSSASLIAAREALGFKSDVVSLDRLRDSDETSYEYGAPLSPQEIRRMSERLAIEQASGELIELVHSPNSHFAGIWFEHPDGGDLVVVATTSKTSDSEIATMRSLIPSGAAFEIRQAQVSYAELLTAQQRWHAGSSEGSASWIDIVNNQLVVSPGGDGDATTLVNLGVPTAVERVRLEPVLCSNRSACTPYRAGIYLNFPNELCTWGWIAKTNLVSQLNVISAGHCATLGQTGSHNGVTVTVSAGVNRNTFDMFGTQRSDSLRAPLANSANLAQPYNLLYLSDTNKSWAMTLKEYTGTQTVGETACFDGRVSGNVCGTIEAIGISGPATRFDGKSQSFTNLIRINRPAVDGDSGAPVRIGATVLGLVDFADAGHSNHMVYAATDGVEQPLDVKICITSSCT